MFEGVTIGSVFAVAVGACITITILNHKSGGDLETRTSALIKQKEKEIIDVEILRILRAIPSRTRVLDEQRRTDILRPIAAYRRVEAIRHDVTKIRDETTNALVLLPLCALVSIASGWLWDSHNAFFAFATAIALLLFAFGFLSGVYPVRKIRQLENINTRIADTKTVRELNDIASKALETILGYTLEDRE
jgi:hypothetical protein